MHEFSKLYGIFISVSVWSILKNIDKETEFHLKFRFYLILSVSLAVALLSIALNGTGRAITLVFVATAYIYALYLFDHARTTYFTKKYPKITTPNKVLGYRYQAIRIEEFIELSRKKNLLKDFPTTLQHIKAVREAYPAASTFKDPLVVILMGGFASMIAVFLSKLPSELFFWITACVMLFVVILLLSRWVVVGPKHSLENKIAEFELFIRLGLMQENLPRQSA